MADGELPKRLLSEEKALEVVRQTLPKLRQPHEAITIRLADPADSKVPENATFTISRPLPHRRGS